MDLLLGLFVAGALALLVAFIFLLGQERKIFDTSSYIKAQFPNVAGLRVGGEVLLGGVVVGHVSEIRFPPLATKDEKAAHQITVVMRVSHSMMPWIRKDSLARIDTQGLLGDKNVNISLGTPSFAQVPDGGTLQSVTPMDLNEALGKAQNVLEDVSQTVTGARKVVDGFIAKGGDKSLAQAAESLKNIVHEVEKGDGIIHKLVYDKKAGADFHEAMDGLNKTIDSVRKTAAHVDGVLAELENGKGLLHSLVYDPDGAKVVGRVSALLKEMEIISNDIRTGNGILHNLVYQKDNGDLVKNINQVAADLQNIVSRVQNGEGTLGRLIVDPTVYEDLKLILSDVKRNKVLKTLIRFGISVNEDRGND
jgi:phospholipid/cholesterol/gamma-HCH transport system substrate-binding protein